MRAAGIVQVGARSKPRHALVTPLQGWSNARPNPKGGARKLACPGLACFWAFGPRKQRREDCHKRWPRPWGSTSIQVPTAFAPEKRRDGGIDGLLLGAEVEDVAIRLRVVQHAIGPAERLNQPVMLEILIDVQRVEVFRIEPGQEHIDDDGDVDLFPPLLRQIGIRELLVLDPLLDVLVVEVELADGVVRAEAGRCSR